MLRLRVTILVALIAGLAIPTGAFAQPDSVRAAILEQKGFSPDHSPRDALWRAAAVPGWGQVYNRQYLKLPFVYAGLAGLGYTIATMHQRYTLHQGAAIYARGQRLASSGETIPPVIADWQSFRDDYAMAVRRAGGNTDDLSSLPLSASQLRRERDRFRRWRDLSIVGTGLFYVLTLVDAYVSAHLLTFDVGETLALTATPAIRLGARTGGVVSRPPGAPGLRLHLRF